MRAWIRKLKQFKIEFEQRSSLWILIIPISLQLAACAARRPIDDWIQSERQQNFSGTVNCMARGSISITDSFSSGRADFKLKFKDEALHPRLDLMILNPFGQIAGSLSLHQGKITGQTEIHMTSELQKYPFIYDWIKFDWPEELRFIFGLPLRKSDSTLFRSSSTSWQKLESSSGRKWICLFQEGRPRKCNLQDSAAEITLNFTSVECLE